MSSYGILEKPHDPRRERLLGLVLTWGSQILLILGAILRFADMELQMRSQGDIIMYVPQADNDVE